METLEKPYAFMFLWGKETHRWEKNRLKENDIGDTLVPSVGQN